ncbi:MAG: MarR family transcriptional regulator [Candidatus Hodarchaeota archaeon]
MSSSKEIRTEFIRLYESMFSRRGLAPIQGRIVAVFLLEQRELTQHELANQVGYSISSVNRALDEMVKRGMLSKRKDERSLRQYVYRMNQDLRGMVGGSLKIILGNTTTSIEEVRDFLKKLDNLGDDSELKHIRSVLEKNEEYLISFIDILEEMIRKLESK